LLGEDRAIVTPIAGTTRDVMEEKVNLSGLTLRIVDTAGFHDSEDPIEQIGIRKAKEQLEKADLILFVADSQDEMTQNDRLPLEMCRGKKILFLLNKIDIKRVDAENEHKFQTSIEQLTQFANEYVTKPTVIAISAKEKDGLQLLREAVIQTVFSGDFEQQKSGFQITNLRQKDELIQARTSILYVKKSIDENLPEDFFTIDFMNAYAALGRIIGEEVGDALIDEIFSKFCLGK
ncbi:MAG: GTP-binding protein, partial [Lachnospiraceae bacterium]|nr:GTP-binding protein [Lachnospiraceae bacterium]